MTKSIVTYSSLVFACLVVVVAFVTATTYTQLAVAAILYPILIFFAYKVLPLRIMVWDSKKAEPEVEEKVQAHEKSDQTESETTGISDINKRAFLKLIGATGLSFFLISIFGRRVESLLFGQNLVQIPTSVGNLPGSTNIASTASPTQEYTISEIDDNIVGYY